MRRRQGLSQGSKIQGGRANIPFVRGREVNAPGKTSGRDTGTPPPSSSVHVRQSKIHAKSIGKGRHTFRTTRIPGYNDTIAPVTDVFADPASERGFSVDIVHWNGKESLHLGGVKVHCDDMVYS